MTYPTLTAFYGSILALIFIAMSGWVVAGRLQNEVLIGDGGKETMSRRIRAHGNFAEYVPFALLMIGFYEADGGSRSLVRILLIILILVRLMHPIGMFAPTNSPQQYIFRGFSIAVTFTIIAISAIMLLLRLG